MGSPALDTLGHDGRRDAGPGVVKDGRRLQFLDSLRGWAAGYVVLYHTALIPTPALDVPGWAKPVVLSGGTGVTLFFLASSFSLCRALRPDENRGRGFTAFAARRFFRIAPLFYFVLMVSVLRDGWLFSVWHGSAEIAANAGFVFNLVPGLETGIVWASWTIGVEALFYVMFPFMAFRATGVASALVLLVSTLLIAAAMPGLLASLLGSPAGTAVQGQFSFLRHLPVFIFGIVAFRVFQRFVEQRFHSAQTGTALVLMSLYLYALLIAGQIPGFPFFDAYYWQAFVYGVLLIGLSIHPSRLVVNRASLFVGRVSYSLYLTHPLIVYALIPVYRYLQSHVRDVGVSFGLCAALTLAAALVVSTMTYALIEAPAMRFGSRLARRLERGKAGG